MTTFASDALRTRMNRDNDYVRFKQLHPTSQLASVWSFPEQSTEFYLADYVARLWVIPTQSQASVCPQCELPYYDLVEHVISQCMTTIHVVDGFIDHVNRVFGSTLVTLLRSYSASELCLVVMGSPTITVTVPEEHKHDFLKACFQLLYQAMECYNCNVVTA